MWREVSGWVKDSKEDSVVVTVVFIFVVDDNVDVPYRLLSGVTLLWLSISINLCIHDNRQG
jgi:hypothetical protein